MILKKLYIIILGDVINGGLKSESKWSINKVIIKKCF